MAERHLEKYSEYVLVYTDGSVAGGRAGSAVVIPSMGYSRAIRLADGVGPFIAELYALSMALDGVAAARTGDRCFAVLMDSLEVVRALSSIGSTPVSDMMYSVQRGIHRMTMEGLNIVVVWLPGHAGVDGNEEADALARRALSHPQIDHKIDLTIHDYIHKIQNYIIHKWQQTWDGDPSSLHYHSIQPLVGIKCKFTYDRGRLMERYITRLRLGKCFLNHYLFKIGRHPTGLCITCGVPETVEHYIIHCKNQARLRAALTNIIAQTVLTLNAVLNNTNCQKQIYNYITQQQQKL